MSSNVRSVECTKSTYTKICSNYLCLTVEQNVLCSKTKVEQFKEKLDVVLRHYPHLPCQRAHKQSWLNNTIGPTVKQIAINCIKWLLFEHSSLPLQPVKYLLFDQRAPYPYPMSSLVSLVEGNEAPYQASRLAIAFMKCQNNRYSE